MRVLGGRDPAKLGYLCEPAAIRVAIVGDLEFVLPASDRRVDGTCAGRVSRNRADSERFAAVL